MFHAPMGSALDFAVHKNATIAVSSAGIMARSFWMSSLPVTGMVMSSAYAKWLTSAEV
jgi:hypothetical protein